MNLASSSLLFSGLPVRDLLRKIKFESTNADIQIALSLFFGTSQKTQQARKESHLTHATDMDHQIRFALKDRVERSITKLASICSHQLKEISIFHLSANLRTEDYTSLVFFSRLQQNGINIQYSNLSEFEKSSELLTATEKEILNSLQSPKKDLPLIINYARERVYTGDYSTAYSVLMEIPLSERDDSTHHILGLCCNFFTNTNESEVHFRRLLASQNLLSKVKATYVLAMLYLRLHPKEKQNLETAEQLLSQGHQLIESHPTMKDYYFHSVFNRNGFALCLFRRGKVQEALEMLQLGIQKLQQSDDGAKLLHQSVLVYNAVQCLKFLKRYDECEQLCQRLLEIDSRFPEYWLELSIVYLEQSKFKQALTALQKAEDLDLFIPEIYALRGYAFLNQGRLNLAITNYEKAVSLAPNSMTYQSDLKYCLDLQPQTFLENNL